MREPGLRDRGAELQVGLLVVFSLLALIVGLFWVSNTRLGGVNLHIHGVAAEAGQITDDAKVYLLGIEVGEVESVKLEGLRVVLDLGLYHDGDLPADTRGVIRAAGFLGTQMVELIPGASESIRRGWEEMRLTEAALTAAIDQFPGDPFLVRKMIDLRKRQLSFLKQIAAIEQTNEVSSRSITT